jgi:hypothetical protein
VGHPPMGYINRELNAAVSEQLSFEAHGGKGNSDAALTHFGHAVHPVTDSASPEHAGYQPWYCLQCRSAYVHHKEEEESARSSKPSDVEARRLAHERAGELWTQYQGQLQYGRDHKGDENKDHEVSKEKK